MQNRLVSIQNLLTIFYDFLDKVEQELSCKLTNANKENRDCCHALTLGLLIRGFKVLGQCILRPQASSICKSIADVYSVLAEMEIYTWPDAQYGSEDHASCDFRKELGPKLDVVYLKIKSPVLDSHRLHMAKQWTKGQPVTTSTSDQ
jgi:hypothetical protein